MNMAAITTLSPFVVMAILLVVLPDTILATPHGNSEQSYKYHMHVNSTSSVSCCDLNAALTRAHNLTSNDSILITLDAGKFRLSLNNITTFVKWKHFAIVGQSMDETTIECDANVGLAFFQSVDIMIRNVTISNCGTPQTSTSTVFHNSDGGSSQTSSFSFLKFSVALFFLSCTNITLDHITVTESSGTGVAIYNSGGSNKFFGCTFSSNNPVDGFGGGGVIIEFSYCNPGDLTCNNSVSAVQVTDSFYHFQDRCQFTYNNASSGQKAIQAPYPYGTEHMAFGKGGGISIHFKGRSRGNTVRMDDCIMRGNGAQWGGGMYMGFGDQSTNNSLQVNGGFVWLNNVECKSCLGHTTKPTEGNGAGGGVRIEFINYPAETHLWPGYISNVTQNNVTFSGTNCNVNSACLGGGVSVVTSHDNSGQSSSNLLLFDSCNFVSNLAFIASAIDLSPHHPAVTGNSGSMLEPIFKDCEFNKNQQCLSNLTHYDVSMSAFYANRVPVRFAGTALFSQNFGSAMVVSDTHVMLMTSSHMNFTGNTGRRGGALSFVDNAWMVAYEDTRLLFDNNSVGMEGLGGAIFSIHFGEHNVVSERNCFFRYYKYWEHPSLWNTSISFSGNTAKNSVNSIFVTSVLPCAWPEPNSTEIKLSSTFCSHPWIFRDNGHDCTTQVATGPNDMSISNITLHAWPGWSTQLGIETTNDYGLKMPTVLRAVPYKSEDMQYVGVSNQTEYIADDRIIFHGRVGEKRDVVFQTLDPRVIASRVWVKIMPCPPGFTPIGCDNDSNDFTCDCRCSQLGSGIKCDNETHDAKLLSYNCLTFSYRSNGTLDKNSSLVYGKCPYNSRLIQLHHNFTNHSKLNDAVCGPLNRTGTLCSQCKPGYGVDVNSYNYRCIKCKPGSGWAFYLLLEILPITVFFMIIAIFHVSAASGPLNAFVFFSQIITIPYFHNPYPFIFSPDFLSKPLEATVLTPYGIWNLDFLTSSVFPGACLSPHLGTMEVIALNYIKAFYPMFLILVCYVLIKLYDRNFKVVHWLWKPFRWCLKRLHRHHEPKTSIINAFATILLLSYTKFMYVSFPLLNTQQIQSLETGSHQQVYYFDATVEAFKGKYAVLAIVAVVVFSVFVALPPIILFLYPTKLFQKCASRLPFQLSLKTFADAFQGDFKDGFEGGLDCRCFSGLYFIFRIVLFGIYVGQLQWAEQYLIQQLFFTFCFVLFTMVKPYKVEFYNKLDISFFTLLSILNVLSFFNSFLFTISGETSMPVFIVNYILIFLPLVYITSYVVYLFLLWMGYLSRWKKVVQKPIETTVAVSDASFNDSFDSVQQTRYTSDSDEEIPDRLLNPQNYAARNTYRPPHVHPTRQQVPATKPGIQSEGTYFLEQERRRQFMAYGSMDISRERSTEPLLPRNSHPPSQKFRRVV